MTTEPNYSKVPANDKARLAPAILVLERTPRVETMLKQAFGDSRCLIRPCRSPGDLIALAERMPASVCVLDWSGWQTELLGLLDRLQLAHCGAQPVVIGTRQLAPLEWAAREAGAIGFFVPILSENEVICLCGRLLGQQSGSDVVGTATPRAK